MEAPISNALKLEDTFKVQLEKIKRDNPEITKKEIKILRDFFYIGCSKMYNLYEHTLYSLDKEKVSRARQYIYNQLLEKKIEEKHE